MNLSRLKNPLGSDDEILTSEEKTEVEAIKKRNLWIPIEDAEAHFRVMDKMAEYEKV